MRHDASRPLFISFYCGDVYYARAADKLRENFVALGIPLLIEAVPDQGGYWRNTLAKPRFIREKLAQLRHDLIWIDADTRLLRDHAAFQLLESDLTMASHSGDLRGVKASPVGIAYNDRSLAFIDAWAAACDRRADEGEIDFDHDILKYEILPAFAGLVSLRLMGDAAAPREFTEGQTLVNGLSGRSRGALATVLARNNIRKAAFERLTLAEFTQTTTL
jgi:hypothetical protein